MLNGGLHNIVLTIILHQIWSVPRYIFYRRLNYVTLITAFVLPNYCTSVVCQRTHVLTLGQPSRRVFPHDFGCVARIRFARTHTFPGPWLTPSCLSPDIAYENADTVASTYRQTCIT